MGNKVNEIITEKFISRVEDSGYLPWQKPWEIIDNQNLKSHHIYTGVNRWMTLLSNHSCPFWSTFKGIKEAGGNVNKGEKGTPIIFVKTCTNSEDKKYNLLRYYAVFNLEQTTVGIPDEVKSEQARLSIENLLSSRRMPTIKHGDSRAFYSPNLDKIHLPYLDSFSSKQAYFCALFHELVHSTGHSERLDRTAIFGPDEMKKESYSFEELVAEIGAALLCKLTDNFNQEVEDNSVAYVRNWKARLSNNNDWLIKAASKAEKAVNYLLGE